MTTFKTILSVELAMASTFNSILFLDHLESHTNKDNSQSVNQSHKSAGIDSYWFIGWLMRR